MAQTIFNKFLFYKTLKGFDDDLAAGKFSSNSIVFVDQPEVVESGTQGQNDYVAPIRAQRFIYTHTKKFDVNPESSTFNTLVDAIKGRLDILEGADSVTNSVAAKIKTAINALDFAEVDGETTGEAIVKISEENGIISATKGDIAAAHVTVADASGKLDATDVEAALAEIVGMIEALDSDVAAGADKYFTGIELKNGKLVGTSVANSKTTVANVDSAKIVDYQAINENTAQTLANTDTIAQAIAKVQKNVEVEAATRQSAIEALDYTIPANSHTDGKAVTAVSETDGVISVTEGIIKSEYVSYDKVNIGTEQDPVYNTSNTDIQAVITEIFAKIAANEEAGEVEVYKDSIDANNKVNTIAADGHDYIFAQGGTAVATLNIAKDMVVSGGEVITADGTEKAGTGASAASAGLTSGEKYIKLTIANGVDTANLLYIPVNSLYKDHTVEANATKVQLAIDNNNVISASVVANSLEWGDLKSTLQNKVTAQKTSITEIASGTGVHITVAKTAGNDSTGTGDSYTIAEHDIASANALTAEETRAQIAETAIDGAIGLTKGAENETRTWTNTTNYNGGATATVKANMQAIDTQVKTNTDAIVTLNGEAIKSIKVNNVNATISSNAATVTIDGSDIALTGYTAKENATSSDVAATDTVNEAIAKLEDQVIAAEAAAKSYADGITVNGQSQTSQAITIEADDIDIQTGYAKAATDADINAGDSISEAFGKVEKKIDNINSGSPFEYTNVSNKSTVLKGSNLTAQNVSEVAVGKYNVSTSGKTQFSVGIGAANAQKNGIEVQNDGTIIIYPYASDGTFSTTSAILQEILHNEIDWYEGN